MKGLQLLLQSLGIKIDPSEVEKAFNQGKEALPRIATAVEGFEKRLAAIEKLLLERK